MECHGTPKRKYFCKQACRVLKKTRAKLQRTEVKWVLRSGTPSSDDPAVNSHVRPWGRGWGAGLARLAGYRTLSTLLGCVRLASDAFVRRAKPNKTGGKSINTELRELRHQLGNAFPLSRVSHPQGWSGLTRCCTG